jgi:CBS domain-containing protein
MAPAFAGRSVHRMISETTQPRPADAVRPAFRNQTVAGVMSPGIITCAPETPLETVAEMMATHRVHAVAVGGIAANHLVWGVIDSLDLVRALHDPEAHNHAESISRQPALSIEPGATLADAIGLMDEHGIAHLVVVDRERPVGVISTLDVAAAAARGRT